MTVVIVVPGQAEPWQVADGAFRLLIDEVRALDSSAEVIDLILRGQIFQALDLTAMDSPTRTGVATVLSDAARSLRRKLANRESLDEWEAGLAERLRVLEMWMEGLLSEQ